MLLHKINPVDSVENLRFRVERLFSGFARKASQDGQLTLDISSNVCHEDDFSHPSRSITEFLNFITSAIPDGDVYLFGGVLRDLALHGRKGFNSDIDLVVEGGWSHFVSYLESLNAYKNKFGGYRLMVGGWPVDIWNAENTWAIKQGLVRYKDIASLTETTVLNWDAILMNWRTRNFIYKENYFDEINEGILDIVLEDNPNPLGMAVRVFRHIYLKDAKKFTVSAIEYLEKCVKRYSFEDIRDAEIRSYKNSVIQLPMYRTFKQMHFLDDNDIKNKFINASNVIEKELDLRV